MRGKELHPILKILNGFLKAQERFLLGILDNSYNGAPVQAWVLHLKALKLVLENKFSSTSNSHFMQVPIIAIIEFLGIDVAFFYNAGKFMCRSVRTRGEGIGCGASYGEWIIRKQKRRREAFFFSWLYMG